MMTTERTEWDYVTATEADVDLAALGRDGWELTGVGPSGTLYFKRPAPDFRERITLDQRRAVEESRHETSGETRS
jgi:hypothetical protein